MSSARPGVEYAVRLVKFTNERYKNDDQSLASIWDQVDDHYNDMMMLKGGDKLLALDKFCHSLQTQWGKGSKEISLSLRDLLQIVQWKFTKGKARPALMKHLNSNANEQIQSISKKAFGKSEDGDISGALDILCNGIKGVGPATASAILSLHREDLFVFMDDEVIDCLGNLKKRAYTTKVYLDLNQKCTQLANCLGRGWTPRRVGRVIWTAARLGATGKGDDILMTLLKEVDDTNDDPPLTIVEKVKGGMNKKRRSQPSDMTTTEAVECEAATASPSKKAKIPSATGDVLLTRRRSKRKRITVK